jgi:hypothetical protein
MEDRKFAEPEKEPRANGTKRSALEKSLDSSSQSETVGRCL